MNNRRRAIMGIKKSRLPSEYQEVEYLESTGEQYIDTGVFVSSTDSLHCKFRISSSNRYSMIYGCMLGNSKVRLAIQPGSAWFATWGNELTISSPLINLNTDYTIEIINNTLYVNGTTRGQFTTPFVGNNPLFVFGSNWDGGQRHLIGRIYEFYIGDIINYTPCYRKSDNKPGMYDLVNDVFYVNANQSASQDFIVGPDV